MPSSTSSFEADSTLGRAPARNWRRDWTFTLILAALLLGAVEAGWRHLGHPATVVDTPLLWSFHRGRLKAAGDRVVALAGTSRTQVGIDPRHLAARLPGWSVVQLGIDGTYAASTLKDLADDPTFRGVILCDTLGPAEADPAGRWNQAPWVRTFHTKRFTFEPAASLLSARIQEHLVLVSPGLGLRAVISSLLSARRLPRPTSLVTRSDRLRLVDYARRDLEGLRRSWIRMVKTDADQPAATRRATSAEHVRFLSDIGARLRARGGRLVILRMPRSVSLRQIEDSVYPPEWWWRDLTANPELVAIDAAVEPRLAGFVCPDDSHLDRRDLPEFAASLAVVLRERGVFGEAAGGPVAGGTWPANQGH